MADPDLHARAEVVSPLIRSACAALVSAMDDLGGADARRAFARMVDDPTETIMWETVDGPRAWDAYAAGGSLQAQHVELLVGPDTTLSPTELTAMLRALSEAEGVRVEGTGDPWRFSLQGPRLPQVSAMVLPMQGSGGPEDLMVQVCFGANRLVEEGIASAELIGAVWKKATTAAMSNWYTVNSKRPLTDHPGFAQVVERPALGSPGIYLVRIPRFPFSPFMPVELYQRPVAWAVFETAAEFRECERYYQTPGASVFPKLPILRNRPPCTDRPARLAGGIAEAGHRLVGTPWSDVGAVSVITLPAQMLENWLPEERASLHRGRYAIHPARTLDEAKRIVRDVYGPGLDPKTITLAQSLHPKAAPGVAVGSPKLIVVAEPGIEHEAHTLFLAHEVLRKHPVPIGSPAVVIVGENADLAEALGRHVRVGIVATAGDAGGAMAEVLASQSRVVVLDTEALAFASMALPRRVERGHHGVTLAVMALLGDTGPVVDLASKLDAKVILVEPAESVGASPGSDLTLLMGRLQRAGLPCMRVPSVPAPPVPLWQIANEIWFRGEDKHHG